MTRSKFLAGALLATTCAVRGLLAQPAWRDIPTLLGRMNEAMAYDPVRERVVLFGGRSPFVRGDTWVWDGRRWTKMRPRHAPSPRRDHVMAYDPNRGTVLLFGGVDQANKTLGDTWEWDGRDWRRIATRRAPAPRAAAAMATDWIRGRVVLFGGTLTMGLFRLTPMNDTWEWDGKQWTEIRPATRPEIRVDVRMAFHPRTGRVTMFGGGVNAGFDTVWEWDGRTWRWFRASNGPTGKNAVALATDPTTGHVLVYEGRRRSGDTWLWNGAAWTKYARVPGRPPGGPIPVAVGDLARKQVLLLNFFADDSRATWAWRGAAWQVAWDAPMPNEHTMEAVHDSMRDETLLIDRKGNYGPLQVWALRGERFVKRATRTSPPWRGASAVGYHAASGKTVLWGGSDGRLREDTWVWDGASWSAFTRKPSPGFAQGATIRPLIYDKRRRKLVLFGYTEIWTWDPQGWSLWRREKQPIRSMGIAGVHDAASDRFLFYGQRSTRTGPVPETWEWDTKRWRQIKTAARPGSPLGMFHVPFLGGIVLLTTQRSGCCKNKNLLWRWTGTDWQILPSRLADSARAPWKAIYDPGRQRILAFFAFNRIHDLSISPVWELRPDRLSLDQPYPRPGERVRIDLAMPSQAARPYLLGLAASRRPGIPLHPVPGVGVELLPLSPDPLLLASLRAGIGGVLDRNGKGSVTLPIPRAPWLVGFDFHSAAFTIDKGPAAGAVTNPVTFRIVR